MILKNPKIHYSCAVHTEQYHVVIDFEAVGKTIFFITTLNAQNIA